MARTRTVVLGRTGTEFRFAADFDEPLRRWLREPDGLLPGADVELLRFDMRRRAGPAPPAGGCAHEGVPVWLTREGHRLRCDGPLGTGGEVDLATGTGTVWAPPGHPEACWRAIHHCLRPLWYAALARRGLHPVHASAVVGPAGAICLAGASGAGKSTLAGRLAGRGARFLSDDVCFVDETTFELYGLGDACRLRPGAEPLLPTLGAEPNGKRPAFVGTPTNGPATPRLLVLLASVAAGSSTWRAADPADAMAALVVSGFLAMDPAVDGRRLQTLGRLAERCPAIFVDRGAVPPSDDLLGTWLDGPTEDVTG